MPDTRSHRGPDPEDEALFAPDQWPALRMAVSDLSWLLSRGYAIPSATELVGNRHSLSRRQRIAVARCACADDNLAGRQRRQLVPPLQHQQELWLDGYNVLTAVESALAGGVILLGRDGCCRDLASVHAHYRKVEETIPALKLVGEATVELGVHKCHWWLDQPVSNSGRLKAVILELAAAAGHDWQVDLVFNPDKVLAQTEQVVASSDSVILDRCQRWINLAALIIRQRVPDARLIDLSLRAPEASG